MNIHHAALLGFLLAAPLAAQGPITQGNIVVLRIGDGINALTSASTATYLDEYTPTGAFVQTIPMPVFGSGLNQPLTNSGTATSEGFLNLSGDGQYLVCGGYASPPGTGTIASTTAAAFPRVIATVSLAGVVDTSTTLGGAFSGGNIRSATSPEGVQFYAAGSNGGVQYTFLGPNTPVALNSAAPTNTRVVSIYDGQLYLSASSGTFQGVGTLGTGLPTTAGQTPALLNGFPTTSGPSSYDFWFADPSTVYVADDRGGGNGGLHKWTESGGVWTEQYLIPFSTAIGCRGVTGVSCDGTTTLYATLSSGAQLVTAVDNGPGSQLTFLAQAPTNTVFRGVRRIEVAPVFGVFGTGSPSAGGVPTIGSLNGQPRVGNLNWGISSSNWPAFTAGGLILTAGAVLPGVQIPGAQPGALLYANLPETLLFIAFSDAGGNVNQLVGVPCTPALAGLQAGGQWIVLDGSLPYALQFATSPGVQLVLGY